MARRTKLSAQSPAAGRPQAMVVKTAKEVLKTFLLFEFLSNSGKRRMRAIKRMFPSSDPLSEV
jgi:hypothetical protein